MTGILDARPKVGYFYSGISGASLVGNKIKDKKVKDIMSMPVVIKQDTNIYDSIVTMFLSDVGSVFIIDENENLCGIVSRKDLLKATIGSADINKMPVGMVMTRTPNVITTNKEDDVVLAAKKIIEHEVDSIPVVEINEEDTNQIKVIGRLSKLSLIHIYYVYVVDNEERLVGVLSLRELILARDSSIVKDLMSENIISVFVDEDREEAVRLVSKYNLIAIPVIDREHRLKGIITVDDIIDVMEEEATEDMYKFAGTSEHEIDIAQNVNKTATEQIFSSVRARIPWLIITLLAGLLSLSLIHI